MRRSATQPSRGYGLSLELLGISVDFVRAALGTGDLARVARDHDVPAAVVVENDPAIVRIWTDPTRLPREPETRLEQGNWGEAMLALRAVEVIRGRLLPTPPATSHRDQENHSATGQAERPGGRTATAQEPLVGPASSNGTNAPAEATLHTGASPTAVRDATVASGSRRRRFSGFGGPSLMASPGLGALSEVWVGARWVPIDHLELHVWSAIPISTAVISAPPQGSIELRVGAIGASLCYPLLSPAGDLFASAGVGKTTEPSSSSCAWLRIAGC